MQKISRPVSDKSARHASPKRTRVIASTGASAGASAGTSGRASTGPAKPALRPTLTRITGDFDLVAPRGFCASVLLKLVSRDDGHRYYSWWAMVGRHDVDSFTIRYKYRGEDLIRCDLPEGMALSEESLQPHLVNFLAGEHNEPDGTPIIRD
jgi:hypothetical protein